MPSFSALTLLTEQQVLAWISVCSEVQMVQMVPLPPTVSYFSKIHVNYTFLIPAHLVNNKKRQLNGCCCCNKKFNGKT